MKSKSTPPIRVFTLGETYNYIQEVIGNQQLQQKKLNTYTKRYTL